VQAPASSCWSPAYSLLFRFVTSCSLPLRHIATSILVFLMSLRERGEVAGSPPAQMRQEAGEPAGLGGFSRRFSAVAIVGITTALPRRVQAGRRQCKCVQRQVVLPS